MTAGAKTSCRPARTALISSMAAQTAVDIAPRAIFGKPEMPDLRALKQGLNAGALTACFIRLSTASRESPGQAFRGTGRKGDPHTMTPL